MTRQMVNPRDNLVYFLFPLIDSDLSSTAVRKPPIKYTPMVIARFWAKVSVGRERGCWLWNGGQDDDGYGLFKVDYMQYKASRVSWELFNHKSLGKYDACHTCDNPPCVNPYHLFAGTCKNNSDDAKAKGRLKGFSSPGQSNPNSKLKENDVDQIRMMLEMGLPNTQIAMYMNVTHSMISRIRLGKSWTHI